jgi:hypothetical protein
VKNFRDSNIEYNKVKQAIKGQLEYILADRRQLIRMAVQSVIELLRRDPQKFHSFYYNQSTMQPENSGDPLLVEAEQLYGKMLENISNKVVTNLNDNISYQQVFAQQELCSEQALHPNFDGTEIDSNNTTKVLCDNTVSQLQADGSGADIS